MFSINPQYLFLHQLVFALALFSLLFLCVFYLNKKNKVIDKKKIGEGGTDSCIIDPKLILQHALLSLAAGIIIFHNHPSGNLQPSKQDLRFTERLKAGCDVMDIKLMDHLIIAENGYYSFADEGLL